MYWPLQGQHLMKSIPWGFRGQPYFLLFLFCLVSYIKGLSLASFSIRVSVGSEILGTLEL